MERVENLQNSGSYLLVMLYGRVKLEEVDFMLLTLLSCPSQVTVQSQDGVKGKEKKK